MPTRFKRKISPKSYIDEHVKNDSTQATGRKLFRQNMGNRYPTEGQRCSKQKKLAHQWLAFRHANEHQGYNT